MNLKKNLVLGLLLLFSIFWASEALASSMQITISQVSNSLGEVVCTAPVPYTPFCYENIGDYGVPTGPGLFTQQFIWKGTTGLSFFDKVYSPENIPPPYTSVEIGYGFAHLGPLTFALNQDGALRFTDASWDATFVINGTETPIFHLDASADLINNGGYGTDSDTVSVFLADVTYPVDWGYIETWEAYYTFFEAVQDFEIKFTLAGHVIDTSAPAPLPPSIVLLGSGLLGLGFYGRRKFICRK